MKIEHIGFIVPAPVSMGEWYSKNFSLEVLRKLGDDEQGVVFLKDPESGTVLEFAKLKEIDPLPFRNLPDLQVHLAFESDDPLETIRQLEKAGAVFIGESPKAEAENERFLLKDLWGITIQIIKRKNRLEN